VSLSAGQQRTLSCIADELGASDPKLASMLGVFNRLASDEEMPARRRAGGSQQQEAGDLRRTGRRARKRRLRCRSVNVVWPVLTWILVTAALITAAIVLGNIGHESDGRWDCPQLGLTTCAQHDAHSYSQHSPVFGASSGRTATWTHARALGMQPRYQRRGLWRPYYQSMAAGSPSDLAGPRPRIGGNPRSYVR
jgi:hypothetical protein